MKVFLSLLLLIPTAFAGTVISERTISLPVEISQTKVKLSSAGYSRPLVKVLIPALADITLLNHRNFGESAPCMSTVGADIPEDVIQNNEKKELVKFTVTLIKTVTPDVQNKVCSVI